MFYFKGFRFTFVAEKVILNELFHSLKPGQKCVLCKKSGGVMKKLTGKVRGKKKQFAHIVCALGSEVLYFDKTRMIREPAMKKSSKKRKSMEIKGVLVKVKSNFELFEV